MENYRSRRVSFGAESDRVGRTFMEIPEHLRQPRMPLGAIHGGDIDSADVSFDGLSCPGGVPYFQRQQTGALEGRWLTLGFDQPMTRRRQGRVLPIETNLGQLLTNAGDVPHHQAPIGE